MSAMAVMMMVVGLGSAQAASMVLDLTVPARYHAEVLVQSGAPVQLLGSNNLNARATMVAMALEMSCTGQSKSQGWMLRCDVDSAQLQGTSLAPPEQERLDAIMAEFGALLSDAYVQVEVGMDGRVRMVDLEGVDKRDERMSVVHEYIRLLVRRAFAPVDLQLPKKGVAEVGDRWKHKGSALAMEVFSRFGTVGGSAVQYEVLPSAVEGGVVVQRSGRGNIGTSSAGSTVSMEDGSQESLGSGLYNTTSVGMVRLQDATPGGWVYAEYSTQGTLNQAASSLVDQFTHAAWIGRINSDGTVEGAEGPTQLNQ